MATRVIVEAMQEQAQIRGGALPLTGVETCSTLETCQAELLVNRKYRAVLNHVCLLVASTSPSVTILSAVSSDAQWGARHMSVGAKPTESHSA